ncbi:Queuine tRNA-ribosyltransferase subunit qtrtd1 [Mortierella sp. AM989]|nr:Queuine tRNA-ribosyltransferase subunit qtrtd1 [Mortierella sp. AM989]
MSPLTFNIIRQSTQLSAARRGTIAMSQTQTTSEKKGKDSVIDAPGSNAAVPSKRVMETPGCFMYSVKGSVPHFTPDTLRLQGFGGVNVSIEHILQDHQPIGLDKWPFTLSKFLNLQDFILLCDIRDSSRYSKVPFNSDRYVSMVTYQGVRQLTLEEYLKIVRVYEPDIVAAFADSISDLDHTELGKLTGPDPGSKRVRKSVDRSLKWLDQILKERQGFDTVAEERTKEAEAKKSRKKKQEVVKGDAAVEQIEKDTKALELNSTAVEAKPTLKPWNGVSVFAHVVGAQNEQERIRSAQETAKRQEVDGFIIDTNTLLGSKDEVLNLLKVSLDHLPKEKPRLVYGMQTPEDVLKSIALGADLFDTAYPFQLTEDGKASLYSFGASSSPSSSGIDHNASDGLKKRWINLWDEEHQDKFVPLLEDCECYACKGGRHTRAFINHLLKAHEMLATVLLMSHNMHQYNKFFGSVRQSIQDGTFEQHSTSFVKAFGTEPERTGEIHPAQAIVEAALSKRNRLDGEEDDTEAINAAAIAAELKKKEKEQMREARRTKVKEDGLRRQAEMKKKKQQEEGKEAQEVEGSTEKP